MRIKGILFLSAVLLCTIITFNGCINEPDIEHPSRPVGLLRFGNFSTNVDSMEISILPGRSDSAAGNLSVVKIVLGPNSLGEYFEKLSGTKNVKVKNLQNGVEVFAKDIEIASWELNSFYFMGKYSVDADSNCFTATQIFDGYSYVSHAPVPGTFNMYFLYLAAEPKVFAQFPKNIDIVDLSPAKDTLAAASLTHIDEAQELPLQQLYVYTTRDARVGYNYANLKPGKRQFAATKEFDIKTVLVKDADSTDYTANKNWYFIVSGDKSVLKYKVVGFNPPPVRAK